MNMSFKLSEHFSFAEMTRTSSGLPNSPLDQVDLMRNGETLCNDLLEPIRTLLGSPLKITSGYRTLQVNAFVGGSINSDHTKFLAADFVPTNSSVMNAWRVIYQHRLELPLKQAILYPYVPFIHVSFGLNLVPEFLVSYTHGSFEPWREGMPS